MKRYAGPEILRHGHFHDRDGDFLFDRSGDSTWSRVVLASMVLVRGDGPRPWRPWPVHGRRAQATPGLPSARRQRARTESNARWFSCSSTGPIVARLPKCECGPSGGGYVSVRHWITCWRTVVAARVPCGSCGVRPESAGLRCCVVAAGRVGIAGRGDCPAADGVPCRRRPVARRRFHTGPGLRRTPPLPPGDHDHARPTRPLATVSGCTPVATATALIPPRPSSAASAPSTRRRPCRSSRYGRSTAYLRAAASPLSPSSAIPQR